METSLNALLAATRIALTCALLVLSCSADDAHQQEASELLGKAAALQNMRAQGAKPFHLHMVAHAQHIVSKPMDGTYDEIWLGPDKWRREITFPGFSQVEVGDQSSKWLSRNLDFRPIPAHLMTVAVEIFVHPEVLQDEKITAIRGKKKKGVELRCIELAEPRSVAKQEICFQSSGELSSVELKDERFEYDDYSKFGDRIFPKTIRVYDSGNAALNISVADLAPPQDSRPDLFQRGTDARQMAPCERSPAERPSKKVAPQYPPEALSSHQQGTVTLYALLSGDGGVEETRVLGSAGASLDRAAAESVRQWMYAPVKCGAGLPTEIEVRVNFSLRVF